MIYHIVWTQHVAYMQMIVFYTGALIHFTILLSYKVIYCSLNMHWSKQWKMLFNIDKCTVLSVTLKQHPFHAEYFLYRQHLALVSSAMQLFRCHN